MINTIEKKFVNFCGTSHMMFARIALFIVFFWFGALKVVNMSPASPLVQALFERTMPIMSFSLFLVLFGLFECLIGILFLIRGAERIVLPLLFLHMFTTIMPLFLLPEATWMGFLAPTMEGQYIIKNVLIIALAFVIGARLNVESEHTTA